MSMELSCCYYQMAKAFLSMVDLIGDSFRQQSLWHYTSSGTPLSAVSGYDIYLPFLCLDILQLLVLALGSYSSLVCIIQ